MSSHFETIANREKGLHKSLTAGQMAMIAIGGAIGTGLFLVYMAYWFPAVPQWIWVLLFSGALVAVNAMSVKSFGFVEYWFSTIKIAAIVGFILIGAYVVFGSRPTGVGLENYTAHGGFFPNGAWGTWVAVVVAIFSYMSIETIAVAAGEAQDPERAVTRAFRATIVRLVVFYLASIFLMLAIVPWNAASADKSPFVKVMEIIGIPGAAAVINFVVLIAALSAMNSLLYISTRMMFSLSRAGHAAERFGRVSASGVPVDALALSCAGIAVATLLSVIAPKESFGLMMAISMFGALFTWLMIFVTHAFFRRAWVAQGNPPLCFRMWGFPWLTLLGAGLILAILVTTYFTPMFRLTLIVGVPFLLALLAIYWVRYRPRQAQEAAGSLVRN
jgi:L-asparagine transporter-like permease